MYIGLIADGNRRWAKERGLATEEGHRAGFGAVRSEVFPVLYDADGVEGLAVYAFSTENWKRSPVEVAYLMRLYAEILDEWVPELVSKGVRVVHAGRKTRVPAFVRRALVEAEEKTKRGRKFTLYLCLDYGGQDELERLHKAGSGALSGRLEVPPLSAIVRTGGEMRLSNFCLYQAAYAELFFLKKKLPALKKADVRRVLRELGERERREGK